jgi:hypothetical protein
MHTTMLYETHLNELAREEKKLRLERLALQARAAAAPARTQRPSLFVTVAPGHAPAGWGIPPQPSRPAGFVAARTTRICAPAGEADPIRC